VLLTQTTDKAAVTCYTSCIVRFV